MLRPTGGADYLFSMVGGLSRLRRAAARRHLSRVYLGTLGAGRVAGKTRGMNSAAEGSSSTLRGGSCAEASAALADCVGVSRGRAHMQRIAFITEGDAILKILEL